MKTIALLGSPGSGKTRLANAIHDELIRNDGCADCNTPIAIVDNYALAVRDEGEYEIGPRGGYMANISIAVERYNRERKVSNEQYKTLITCGTIIETSVYLVQGFEKSMESKPTNEAKMEEAQRIKGCINMLAVLYMDTFKYDKAFYMPPSKPHPTENWTTFERNLQAAFQAFNAPVSPLLIENFKDEDDLVRQQVEKVLS